MTDIPAPAYEGEFRMGEVPPEARPLVMAAMAQAREDAFNLVRDALRDNAGTPDRWTFLQYCLSGWIESGHQGFLIVKYDSGLSDYDIRYTPGLPPGTTRRPANLTVIDQGDEDYDSAAVEMILRTGKVCGRCGAPIEPSGDDAWMDWTCSKTCHENSDEIHEPTQAVFEVTHETVEKGLALIRSAVDVPNTGTGNWERDLTSVPFLGQGLRNLIIEADLTNESSNLDVWSYSAILEIALFGEVRYA